jgi:ABC-type lipoprotein release transport system permease subunit
MVLGVTLPAFVSTMLIDAVWPFVLSYASHASLVSPAPTYQSVDPAILAEIRAHPAVADVIPVKALTVMANVVPFEFPLPVYGVREENMQALLDVYDLHIAEGEMFQPRSSQIVLTRALARNRGLRVGDLVGRSVHEMDSMPTELTIAGLLDSHTRGLTERKGYRIPTAPRWAGFVSYEFVESHEEYDAAPMRALVIPVEGRETEVEAWLEKSIDTPQVDVETFGTVYRWWHDFTQMAMSSLAITETTLAVVAAGALAILNYIFVIQRRDEFGVLHAVGRSRAGLVARTVQESATIAGVAWVIGAACCLLFVLGAQAIIYAPKGMSLYLTDIVPWLFTLPIPLVTIAASAGTIAWALSRIDPVTVIERR